jgi:hypothetical protein
MNHNSQLAERIRKVFQPTERGVIGLDNSLLELSRGHRLRFEFQDNERHVRPSDSDIQDSIDVPLSRSVFRAILARVATLCNEQVPNAVTPYRGEGEISVCTNPPATFRVAFTNTPAVQQLELEYVRHSGD